MVTGVPTGPDVGHSVVIEGAVPAVKGIPLLASPPTVTTMLPVLAPLGTVTVMLVSVHLPAAPALTPLKVTVLVP
jgi:hypothetical protein